MRELETPSAIVAKVDKEMCHSAIENLAAEISPLYKEGLKLRTRLNGVGIEIGRRIIDVCRGAEVETRLAVLNSKENKIKNGGGTDTRAHSWVADQLAKISGYNAEYLKQCAREYLGALKLHCEQTRQEAPEWGKGGMLKCALKNLPELEPPIIDPPKHPRMDSLFTSTDSVGEPEKKSPAQRAQQAYERVNSLLGEGDRVAWREFFNAIAPSADAHGFQIMPKGKNGGDFK